MNRLLNIVNNRRVLKTNHQALSPLFCLIHWLIVTGILFSWLILVCNLSKGFDLTDESYYLLSIAQSKNQIGDMSHFGYVLSPLYKLVNKNIVLLKFAGILILWLCGLIFSASFDGYWQAKSFNKNKAKPNRYYIVIASSMVLFYYGWVWLNVPSYNWLALVAALLVGSGLLRAVTILNPFKLRLFDRHWVSCFLIGLGGSLAFMAKPPTALMLACVSCTWFLIHGHRKNSFILLFSSGLISLFFLFLYALIQFNGLAPFFLDFWKAFEYAAVFSAGHSAGETTYNLLINFSLLLKSLFYFPVVDFLLVLLGVGLVHKILLQKAHQDTLKPTSWFHLFIQSAPYIYVTFILITWSCLLLQTLGINVPFFLRLPLQLPLASGVILFVVFFMLFLGASNQFLGMDKTERSNDIAYSRLLRCSCLLVGLVFSFAYGTNNNVLIQIGGANFFFILGIIYLGTQIIPTKVNQLFPRLVILMASINLVLVMLQSYRNPYRLAEDISKQSHTAFLLSTPMPIKVDEITFAYIEKLKTSAIDAGWEPDTPLIDLTGETPGALFILNAQFIGKAWFPGGYPGSNQYAIKALKEVPIRQLKRAWILTAPKGSRKLDDTVLTAQNLIFPQSYDLVGSYHAPMQTTEQFLWKPK